MRQRRLIGLTVVLASVSAVAPSRVARADEEGAWFTNLLLYSSDLTVGALGITAPLLANAGLEKGGNRSRWAVAGLSIASALNAGVGAAWLALAPPGGERTGFAIAHFAVAAFDLAFAIWASTRCCEARTVAVSPTVIPTADSRRPAFGFGITLALP